MHKGKGSYSGIGVIVVPSVRVICLLCTERALLSSVEMLSMNTFFFNRGIGWDLVKEERRDGNGSCFLTPP